MGGPVEIDTTNLEVRADRDRRDHEDALLLLLLGLMSQSRNRADMALSIGADPYAAAADPLAGNIALRIPPAWPRIARKLQAADVAGYERTVRVIRSGTIEAEVGAYTPATDYGQAARMAVGRLVQHARTAISDGIRRAVADGVPVRRGVADSFLRAGLVESATSKAWLIESTAVTLTGFAWSGGWMNGWSRPAVAERITGFRFSALLDTRTTDICRARHGTKVPVDSGWLQWNVPPLHFNCRSVILPMFRDFVATEVPPFEPPPMEGFGRAPAVLAGIRLQPAAA